VLNVAERPAKELAAVACVILTLDVRHYYRLIPLCLAPTSPSAITNIAGYTATCLALTVTGVAAKILGK